MKGTALGREVEEEFSRNPAPHLATIINVFKTLSLQLLSQGAVDPELLKLADQLARTSLGLISEQMKAAFRERELALLEQRYVESQKSEQGRALDFCLELARGVPEIRARFEAAFAALEARKALPGGGGIF